MIYVHTAKQLVWYILFPVSIFFVLANRCFLVSFNSVNSLYPIQKIISALYVYHLMFRFVRLSPIQEKTTVANSHGKNKHLNEKSQVVLPPQRDLSKLNFKLFYQTPPEGSGLTIMFLQYFFVYLIFIDQISHCIDPRQQFFRRVAKKHCLLDTMNK